MNNITTVSINDEHTYARSLPLWQYDYGQILKLEGVELPEYYEVHFSNEEHGESKTVLGDVNGVEIPDEYLQTGKPIYAWVYLHTGASDGETEYMINIPVNRRATPTNVEPTPEQQSLIEQTLAALSAALAETETNVTHYPQIIDGMWFVWDANENQFVNTGEHAEGPKGDKGDTGNGIAAISLNDDYTLTFRYTNGTSYTTGSIRGPKGDPGAPGDPGEPGHSPVLTSSKTGKVTTIYSDGTQLAQILDGEDGGTGTTDYTELENKPSIAGVTLAGNKSLDDFGAASKSNTVLYTTLSINRKAGSSVGTCSVAMGQNVEASGDYSHAENGGTTASGNYSHSEGGGTTASGSNAHSEGGATTASGSNAHSEGGGTTASGAQSHSEGGGTTASGSAAHSEGSGTIAKHYAQHAGGAYNVPDPSDAASTASGTYIEIIGNGGADNARSNARVLDWVGNERLRGDLYVECNNDSTGGKKVATVNDIPDPADLIDDTAGAGNTDKTWSADRLRSVQDLVAYPYEDLTFPVAKNALCVHDGKLYKSTQTIQTEEAWTPSHWWEVTGGSAITGLYTGLDNIGAALAQKYTKPQGGIPATDLASGVIPDVSGKADKTDTVLDTTLSHGRANNNPVGNDSIAYGTYVIASGAQSQAFGSGSTASGSQAHAEGAGTTASGNYSHSEGGGTIASANQAHAEGGGTTASGESAHSENGATEASGKNSHAEGTNTIANHKSQHAGGEWNVADPSSAAATARGTYVEIIGNGTAYNAKSNARTLDWSGNERLAGNLYVGCNSDSSGGKKAATEDVVLVQDTQPTSTDNKIWIDDTNSPTGVQVPTYTELTNLSNAIQEKPETMATDVPQVDLDLTDDNGNVILRLKNGHVETKKFKSENVDEVKGTTADVDIDFVDENLNSILRLKNGHVQTKNFDSESLTGIMARNRDIIDGVYAACRWHQPTATSKQFCILMGGDIHGDRKRMANMVECLNKLDAFDAGIMLGDIGGSTFADDATFYTEEISNTTKPFLTVIGNHDSGGHTSNAELCAKYITPNIGYADLASGEYTEGNCYYYKDFTTYKIRLIVLNQYDYPDGEITYTVGDGCLLQDQIDWFVDVLENTPSDFGVIIANHTWISSMTVDSSSVLTAATASNAYSPHIKMDGYVIPGIVNAWINGTTYSHTFNYDSDLSLEPLTVDVDFSERGAGEFITYIGGHWHMSILSSVYSYSDQKSYHVDCSGISASRQGDTPRMEGTRSEDSICALAVDRTAKTVKIFRIGAHYSMDAVDRIYGKYSY